MGDNGNEDLHHSNRLSMTLSLSFSRTLHGFFKVFTQLKGEYVMMDGC